MLKLARTESHNVVRPTSMSSAPLGWVRWGGQLGSKAGSEMLENAPNTQTQASLLHGESERFPAVPSVFTAALTNQTQHSLPSLTTRRTETCSVELPMQKVSHQHSQRLHILKKKCFHPAVYVLIQKATAYCLAYCPYNCASHPLFAVPVLKGKGSPLRGGYKSSYMYTVRTEFCTCVLYACHCA